MSRSRFILAGLIGLFFSATVHSERAEASKYIPRLCSSDVPTLVSAGDALCALGEQAIPELVALLETERKILPTSKLRATGSYMYPGHGGTGACWPFVFYQLNESQVRAGWLLERITFKDFGFVSEWEGDLHTPAERHASAARAKAWWVSQGTQWNRFVGLREALRSDSTRSQRWALDFLRNRGRDGNCPELTEATYFAEIHPAVQNLLTSKNEIIREFAAEVWTHAERNRSGGRASIFIDKGTPNAANLYLLRNGELSLNGKAVANVGDSFESLQSKVRCADAGGITMLEIVPTLAALIADGKIESWWDIEDDKDLPWGPSRLRWR